MAGTLPPLREHPEDILLLVEHFIKYFNQLHCRQIKGITPRAMDNLTHYSWPGNVRELRNTIEYAFIYIKDNIIDVTDLPYCLTSTWSVSSTGERRKGERRKGERGAGERGAGERRGGEKGAGNRRAGERGESATYPSFAPSSSNILAPTLSQDIKATVLRNALEQNRWHIGHTAEALGIHRTTLWRYMQRLGLPTRN